jgi:AbrB family looped-hinge helix DNA binding protein
MNHTAHVSSGGRVVIPAKLRKAIGLRTGDAVIIRLTQDGLVITTPERAIRAAQALVKEFVPDDRRLADELIAERSHEARQE